LIILGFIGIKLQIRGDERHIIETIRLFTNNLNFETIKNYPEITPPFFFILYATWAKIFGQTVESLRLFTILISFFSWQALFILFDLITKNKKHSFLLSLLIAANPYFFGTSIFVFTDMLTILLSLVAVIGFLKNKFYLYLVASLLAVLCRQYAIIFPISVLVFSFIKFFNDRKLYRKYILASLFTFFPLLILFLVWGNIAPSKGIDQWLIKSSQYFNISYLNTYITFSVLYLFPLTVVFIIKNKEFNKSVLAITIISCTFLSLFPITASSATVQQTDIRTVGYAHIALGKILGENSLALRSILIFFLAVGCYINVLLIKKIVNRISKKTLTRESILSMIWLIFLVIMPFSYQVWEKYLILVLPYLALSIFLELTPKKLNKENSIF
jgi:hypothetical protein